MENVETVEDMALILKLETDEQKEKLANYMKEWEEEQERKKWLNPMTGERLPYPDRILEIHNPTDPAILDVIDEKIKPCKLRRSKCYCGNPASISVGEDTYASRMMDHGGFVIAACHDCYSLQAATILIQALQNQYKGYSPYRIPDYVIKYRWSDGELYDMEEQKLEM